MAYPDRLWRVNINGTIAGGDILTHTVWMRQDGTAIAAGDTTLAVATKVAAAWRDTVAGGTGFPTGLSGVLHDGCAYQGVTAYKVGPDGKATEQASAALPIGPVAGSGGIALPNQCAVAVTLLTARAGRSGRGRIFLGGFNSGVLATTGRLTATSRTTILNAMAGFYTRLRDVPNQPDVIRPVVVSPTLSDSYKIKSVAVGDVIDTMRSRRNKLVEAKASAVVDAS